MTNIFTSSLSYSKSPKKDKYKPKKGVSLLERIQNELEKKKDLEEKQKILQKQLSQILGNECQSFEDITNSISDLQNHNFHKQGQICI